MNNRQQYNRTCKSKNHLSPFFQLGFSGNRISQKTENCNKKTNMSSPSTIQELSKLKNRLSTIDLNCFCNQQIEESNKQKSKEV